MEKNIFFSYPEFWKKKFQLETFFLNPKFFGKIDFYCIFRPLFFENLPKFSKTAPSAPIFGPFGPENGQAIPPWGNFGQAIPPPESSDGKCEGGRKVVRKTLLMTRVFLAQFPSENGQAIPPPEEIFVKRSPPEPEKIARYLVLSTQKKAKNRGSKNFTP